MLTVGMMAGRNGADRPHPSYASIGIAGPILLILCRLRAGLLDRRRMGRAAAFLVEYAPPGKRGLIGSWQQFASASALTSRPAHRRTADLAPRQGDHDLLGLAPALHLGFVLAPVGLLRALAGGRKAPAYRAHEAAAGRGPQCRSGDALTTSATAGAGRLRPGRPSARSATTPSTSTCRPIATKQLGIRARHRLLVGHRSPPSCSPS